jgi:putative endonuclease
MGTIYLLHFDQPLGNLSNPRGQARHYLGYTEDLQARLEAHESGNGAAIMAAVARALVLYPLSLGQRTRGDKYRAGITWTLARTWDGDRVLERRLTGTTRRSCARSAPGQIESENMSRDILLRLRVGRREPLVPNTPMPHVGGGDRWQNGTLLVPIEPRICHVTYFPVSKLAEWNHWFQIPNRRDVWTPKPRRK